MGLTIAITGSEESGLTLSVMRAFQNAETVILHTERCGAAAWLRENGIPFTSLDALYDEAADFDAHIESAVQTVLAAGDSAVFAAMDARDAAVHALLKRKPGAEIVGSEYDCLLARAEAACTVVSALDLESASLSAFNALLVTEIDSRVLAGEVKLRLMDVYGDDAQVSLRQPDGGIARCALENMDRLKIYDHRTACLVNPTGSGKDLEMLLRACREQPADETDDPEKLADALAYAVRGICAGEAFGETDLREVVELALEKLS